jgi:yeast amino acid transporter
MSCSSGSSVVFVWFQNLTTIAGLFTWCSICIAYIQFHKALKAQGISRDTLIFKSPFQPYLAWGSLIYFSMIILFNGFYVWSPWDYQSFITAYIGIPIYFILYFSWKILKRTKWINPAESDIHTGKAALDAADAHWPEQIPRNIIEKFWFWLA